MRASLATGAGYQQRGGRLSTFIILGEWGTEMKKHNSLTLLVLLIAGLISFLINSVGVAKAQIDAFTFFIPYPADILNLQFNVINQDNGPSQDNIVTTISITILRDNTVIYYDHWEDGLEENLTVPRQASTLIIGDSDPVNGFPPGDPSDSPLSQGDVVVQQNVVEVPFNASINPFLFDGGDKLTAVGGNIAVTTAVWPETEGILFAGAWELYPTSRWGTVYLIPVGENLAGTGPNLRNAFGVVGLNIQAAEDDTTIQLDLDADGNFEASQTLNSGYSFSQVSGVQTGAQIQASKPVQVHVLTGNDNPNINFEARAYTVVPRTQWEGDYLAPRSSDGDYWLYNPHSNALPVTVQTRITNTKLITIPPQSTIRYSTGLTMSTATGIHFTAADDFYGVVALDADSAQDWGYALQPTANLFTQELIGWGPGNNNTPPNGDESRVYATALTTTTLTVRYRDGSTANFQISPLAEVPITSPTNDMTGAYLFTTDGTPFMSVWGQDQTAEPALPSIDVGTSIVPIPSLALQKTLSIINDADGSGTVTWGDTVRFTVRADNNSATAIADVVIEDNLPPTVTYIFGSSTINGTVIADNTSGTPFPFDEGGRNVGTIAAFGSVTTAFDAIVNVGAESISNIALTSSPVFTPTDPGQIDIPIKVARYEMNKTLNDPANGQTQRGKIVTFGIGITSTGNISITRLPLEDTFIEDHLTYISSEPFSPDTVASGLLKWDNLAADTRFGPLPPGRRIDLTVRFQVDNVPLSVISTTNIALVRGAQGSDGILLPPISDSENVFLPTPTPKPSENENPPPIIPPSTAIPPPIIRPPTPTFIPGTTPTLTPLPGTPTVTPSPSLFGSPTPTGLPVALLPETGYTPVSPLIVWAMMSLIVTVIWGLWIRNRQTN